MKVDKHNVMSVVPSASCTSKPCAKLISAMDDAMALKKMSPTSCTCVPDKPYAFK